MSKTIEVSDDMYDALMELSIEMTTQDNRCTAMPHLFQVQETKETPAHEGNGEKVLYHSQYETELKTDNEKVDWIKENEEYFIGTMYEEEAKDVGNHTITWDLDSMLEELGFNKFYIEYTHTNSNVFFTSKGCDEHIRINKHNLHKPVNYLNHAFRNAEMELVSKFLCELSGGKLHK